MSRDRDTETPGARTQRRLIPHHGVAKADGGRRPTPQLRTPPPRKGIRHHHHVASETKKLAQVLPIARWGCWTHSHALSAEGRCGGGQGLPLSRGIAADRRHRSLSVGGRTERRRRGCYHAGVHQHVCPRGAWRCATIDSDRDRALIQDVSGTGKNSSAALPIPESLFSCLPYTSHVLTACADVHLHLWRRALNADTHTYTARPYIYLYTYVHTPTLDTHTQTSCTSALHPDAARSAVSVIPLSRAASPQLGAGKQRPSCCLCQRW